MTRRFSEPDVARNHRSKNFLLEEPTNVVGDLLTTLTKFLPLGLSFDEIIAKCTINPARVIGWQDRIGSLEVGREADIAVLQVVNEPTKLHDSVGGELTVNQRIAPRWTIRRGEVFSGSQ